MLRWARGRIRKLRRGWSARAHGKARPPIEGVVTCALCHPDGESPSPTLRTVLRSAAGYRGFADTEIRGFLDGEFKFERNVATQYHVRVGCEGANPLKGRYEVMRILQRWDLSALPSWARVLGVRLVLLQEDCSRFPYRYPLRWPTDFLLYEVKKPWGPGRGGERKDNQSRPERGDAWWREARAGELAWHEPGCGYGSDDDPQADRGGSPLATARVEDVTGPLCFTGDRLAAAVQRAIERGGALSLLLKASSTDEALPGSVKTFFSGEFGDDLNPILRPRLEIEWSAPCLAVEQYPFVLEPAEDLRVVPGFASLASRDGAFVAAVTSLKVAPGKAAPRQPSGPQEAVEFCAAALPLEPAVYLELEGDPPGKAPDLPQETAVPLERPAPTEGKAIRSVRVSAAINPVPAGETLSLGLLETWTPSVPRPDDLEVRVRFQAPSTRSVEVSATYQGEFRYAAQLRPDELGVWTYHWRARPDARFETQQGTGCFTVVPPEPPRDVEALEAMVAAAVAEAGSPLALLARRRCHFRLVALQGHVRRRITTEQASASDSGLLGRLRELLGKIASALPAVD